MSVAQAEGLVFIDVAGFDRNIDAPSSTLESSDIVPVATLFYAQAFDKAKVLLEFIGNEKNSHFGRVQLGWKPNISNVVWLGRTHNPASYWRDQYHHGGWLQPSIKRPAISEFEVPGGVLPSHSTGIMLEGGASESQKSGLSYVVSFGFTSIYGPDGLEVPKLIDSDRGSHSTSFAFRISYRFDEFTGGNEFGLVGASNHLINKVNSAEEEVEQSTLGFFVSWNVSNLKLISEYNYINNDMLDGSSVTVDTEYFSNAYIMGDYSVNNNWNVYARYENTFDEVSNQYLNNFPNFVVKRNMLGLRYSINRSQFLKFEIEDSDVFSGNQYQQLSVQWSYVYP